MFLGITAADPTGAVRAFNWQSPSWDLFILLGWVGAAVFYMFAAGRGRIINILLSVYVAKLLVLEMPFIRQATEKLNFAVQSLQQLAAFVAIFLLLFLFLGRFALKTSADSHRLGSMVFGLVFSFLQIGLLINIILGYLPAHVQQGFNPLIRMVFLDGPAGFVWLVLPITYLVLLGKFIGDTSEI